MERLEWRGNDGALAPGAIPTAVSAEMLAMRLEREVAEVQVRKAALAAGDTGHLAPLFEGPHEIERRRRRQIHARDFVVAKELQAFVVKQRNRGEVAVDDLR